MNKCLKVSFCYPDRERRPTQQPFWYIRISSAALCPPYVVATAALRPPKSTATDASYPAKIFAILICSDEIQRAPSELAHHRDTYLLK